MFSKKMHSFFKELFLGDNKPSFQSAQFNLAVVRIFFYIIVFLTMSSGDYFLEWSNVPSIFWNPLGVMRFLSQPLPKDSIIFLFYVWKWIGVLCIFGIFYRILAPLWFLLTLIVVSNGHSFGYVGHVYAPVVLAALPLCFSRASDVLSLDRILGFSKHHPQADILEYIIPLRTVKLIFVLTYFAAGVAKLRFSGLEWISGNTLRNYFIRSSLIYSDTNFIAHRFSLAEFFYKFPLLCNVLAFGAVILELSAPLAFLRKKVSLVLIPLIAIFQLVIFLTIYVRFTPYLSLIVVWIDWWWLSKILKMKTSFFHKT